VSITGDWVESTTTAWLLYDITRSPLLLGIGGALRAAATIGFGLFGGAVADRVPRRQLLLVTQTSMAAASLALGVLVVTGRVEVWHVYIFSVIVAALGSFDQPTRRALFPTLVQRQDLPNAVMLNSAAVRVGRLIGPAVAGIVIALFGPAVSYFANAVTFVALIAALLAIRARQEPVLRPVPMLRAVADGFRYMIDRPLLRSLLVLDSVQSGLGLNTAIVTIVASDVLHAGPEGLGLLLSSQAAGTLLATLALILIGDVKRKGSTMLASGAAYCLALGAFGFATIGVLSAALMFVCGFTDAIWSTLRTTIVQLAADEAYRGRAMGVLLLSGRGLGQASQIETGVAVSIGGPTFAVVLGAALIAITLAAVNVTSPEVRKYESVAEPQARVAG